MARITGVRRHITTLRRKRADPVKVTRALFAAGSLIEIEAEVSITNGAISGPGHIPSRPGEPPNADTRQLDTSIATSVVRRGANPKVHVTSNAPYSAALEYGTEKMEERPFMRPATKKMRPRAIQVIGRALR